MPGAGFTSSFSEGLVLLHARHHNTILMQFIPTLLIVAGTGTKSGKTTIVCRIIEQFRDQGIIAIRVSPHFHEKTEGLLTVGAGEGYCVSQETNAGTAKDTSRMLRAGASEVYLVETVDELLSDIFMNLMQDIPEGIPVICESQALRNYFEPGIFILISSIHENKRQDLSHLQKLPHLEFDLNGLSGYEEIPILFRNGKWTKKNMKN